MRNAEMAHAVEVKPELAKLDKIIADEEQAINVLHPLVVHIFKIEPATR